MKIGFIGLGNVGGKLASNLLNNNFDLMVFDKNNEVLDQFKERGSKIASSVEELVKKNDILITCLPSPEVCKDVIESPKGIAECINENQIWMEMSTTDEDQLKRHASLIESKRAIALEAPVSGGCHRAATGNISIFVGGKREGFEKALPVLSCLGRRILHVGDFGSASILKVITNYLATVHLVSLGEAWTVAKKSGLDLNKAFKGIAASSGNSFVHETESQVILNGSYNINFTMDLVEKDVGLFENVAKKLGVDLEISPLVLNIIKDAKEKYGSRAWSSMVVKRLEDKYETDFRAPGFPEELVDEEEKVKGYEI
ncbi:NAD(P)-dependent oxidoreductase [Alphaproteobacteria bacterium]|nr:NAD(P)-dependent oxidoreductase [Alphaproteobacteria bacterium]